MIFIVCLVVWKPYLANLGQSNPNIPLPRDLDAAKVQAITDAPLVQGAGGETRTRKSYDPPEPKHDSSLPGENGKAVALVGDEQAEGQKAMKKWFMNLVASDKVSLDRRVPDVRETGCKNMLFDQQLPSASVVVIFHNEAWTPLLRTVHSVINRSPPDLLHEIVLLDDCSDREELGSPLTEYVKRWEGLVKLVRVPERQGLIRARIKGAEAASGDVLVFLDSHCEANFGWLEPLLQRIKDQPNSVLVPSIDMISDNSMAYWGGPTHSVGGFWWSLHFKWDPIPESERKRRKSSIEPVRSPTMPGGLFAMGRKYFFDLGAYDAGMDIWGGENLEISFRTWMCGGVLEFIPCSHVGHIFRAGHPYNMTDKDVHGINSKRLAEVWMDDYKRLFYHHRHEYRTKDVGDLSSRHELRKKLGCKNFKWFLDNIVPDKFIPDEKVYAYGSVKNPSTGLCLDTMQRDEKTVMAVGLFFCQSGGSSAQMFSYSLKKELRREETCMGVAQHTERTDGAKLVKLYACNTLTDAQIQWETTPNEKEGSSIKHVGTGMCLDTHGLSNSDDVVVRKCEDQPSQRWAFEHVL